MTYGEMQARIADDINRTDLNTQIGEAIATAISEYKRKEFYFNQEVATGTCTVGDYNLTLPADFIQPRHLQLKTGGVWYPTSWVSYSQFVYDQIDDTARSLPVEYAIFDDLIWFNIPPDQAYTYRFSYIKDLGTPDGPSYTSAWFTVGEKLIRTHAKYELYANVLRNKDEADKFLTIAVVESLALRKLSSARQASNRLMVSW